MKNILLLFLLSILLCGCVAVVENNEVKFGGNKEEVLDTLQKLEKQEPGHEYIIYDKQKIK